MKTITAAELRKNPNAVLGSAQRERILLTRNGRPSVVLVGVEGLDEEDVRLASSAKFWRMIEQRREGRSIPLSELRTELGLERRHRATKKSKRPVVKSSASRRSSA